MKLSKKIENAALLVMVKLHVRISELCRTLTDQRGQGTTEYAILVGVLVVIAIIAVVAFRGKLEELWTSITSGINSL